MVTMSVVRTRWAAIGAAVAVTLGAGGIGLVDAAKGSGDRAVYTAIEPCRLLDTRPDQGIGGRTTPLGPAETYPLVAHGDHGQCVGIPADTVAVELNVTGLLTTGDTHLTIWDGQAPVPNASHLNLTVGHGPIPNSVTTDLDAGGFAVFNNSATAHVIIDIVGIYQDHTHDDRYYTEAEVNALIATVEDHTHDEVPPTVRTSVRPGPVALAPAAGVNGQTTVNAMFLPAGTHLLTFTATLVNFSGVNDFFRCSIYNTGAIVATNNVFMGPAGTTVASVTVQALVTLTFAGTTAVGSTCGHDTALPNNGTVYLDPGATLTAAVVKQV
jgi:hypothetical protein